MVTIKDVAAEAEVSIATVSRVLNGSGYVSEDTKLRVLRVINRLNYHPMPSIRKKSLYRTLGVLLPNTMGNHYGEIFMGVEDYAHKNGFNVMLAMAREMVSREQEILNEYFQRKVDGVIVATLHSDEHMLNRFIESGIVVVAVDSPIREIKADSVNIDNSFAAYNVAKFLYEKGHRRVLFLPGQEGVHASKERLKGLRKFASRTSDFDLKVARIGGFEPHHGHEAIRDYLRDFGIDFTAIFAVNDHVAMGAMQELHKNGVRVPDDVSVIGFDDSVHAPYTIPALTTVSQPRIEMGSAAAQLLIERLRLTQKRVFRNIVLPTALVERDSVKVI
ncbi:LacI family DNA-binding transcriptional regulator [Mesotoga sp. B105.6.4]|jgi:LacI family transcriptional regulator|uniref:LacI family DNA-binding transcriptional regulator n=1 Tax=Mesotoga sp. B105.6.4 TaxID=1582224 RepID=UPI000CCC0013|nr:LacI family DNA-binding transcriptional regulator [Mesotoga sp. B105.6.4]PNS37177.1 alanine racemase [Mesotoga sp. B105.6.4]